MKENEQQRSLGRRWREPKGSLTLKTYEGQRIAVLSYKERKDVRNSSASLSLS